MHVNAPVPKRSVNPKCVSKPFDLDTACDKGVYDFLVPQQFQDCITVAQPTTQSVSVQQSHKGRHDQGKGRNKGVKTKAHRPWLERRTVDVTRNVYSQLRVSGLEDVVFTMISSRMIAF
jgi:hypothetical protein